MAKPKYGYCYRPNQQSNDGTKKIHLYIEHYGVTRVIQTSYDIRNHEWDTRTNRLIISKEATGRSRKLYDCARSMARNLRLVGEIIGKISLQTKRFTADDVANAFIGAVAGSGMLGVYATILAKDLAFEGVGRAGTAYLTASRRLIAFNGGVDVPLSQISSEMMSAFQDALKREGVSWNTVSFYMRSLRAIYNRAIAEGIIVPRFYFPFDDVYTEIQFGVGGKNVIRDIERYGELVHIKKQRKTGCRAAVANP